MSWPFGDLPLFAFDLIMIDPPWRFETWSDAGRGKSAEQHYDTMSDDEIADLPVGHLAARDCVLWVWGTHPMIDRQIGVARRWGFTFVTSGLGEADQEREAGLRHRLSSSFGQRAVHHRHQRQP